MSSGYKYCNQPAAQTLLLIQHLGFGNRGSGSRMMMLSMQLLLRQLETTYICSERTHKFIDIELRILTEPIGTSTKLKWVGFYVCVGF